MSPRSRLVPGILLILVPTAEIGGVSILSLLISDPQYAQNELGQDLWRAGHPYAGVWLVLSLVALRYVDEATISEGTRWMVASPCRPRRSWCRWASSYLSSPPRRRSLTRLST